MWVGPVPFLLDWWLPVFRSSFVAFSMVLLNQLGPNPGLPMRV